MNANQLQRSARLAVLSLAFEEKPRDGCPVREDSANAVSIGNSRCKMQI
jgi:hypothetical protein